MNKNNLFIYHEAHITSLVRRLGMSTDWRESVRDQRSSRFGALVQASLNFLEQPMCQVRSFFITGTGGKVKPGKLQMFRTASFGRCPLTYPRSGPGRCAGCPNGVTGHGRAEQCQERWWSSTVWVIFLFLFQFFRCFQFLGVLYGAEQKLQVHFQLKCLLQWLIVRDQQLA